MDAWKYEQQPQQQPKNHDMKHDSSMSYFLATSTRAVGSARQLQQYRTARARAENELRPRGEAVLRRAGGGRCLQQADPKQLPRAAFSIAEP